MGLTDFIRKETPHLTPVVIDGFVFVFTPFLGALVTKRGWKVFLGLLIWLAALWLVWTLWPEQE